MYRKILVGTDGSPTASVAVDRAAEVAARFGATLTVLTAGRPERAEAVLARERERLAGRGVAVETVAVDSDPASALVDAAEAGGFDLLVVGNRGMTGVGRFLLGSVPNKVSHHAPCSLLIVHTS